MRRFAATPGGAESPLPAIRRHTGRSRVPVARKRIIPTTTRNRTNAKIKLFAKTAQYRNQIFTLLRVFPLKFLMRQINDENTVWTDSQDYGADEIL